MALERLKQPGRAKAVFIDKDGTLVDDVPYNVDPTVCPADGRGRSSASWYEKGRL